MSDIKQETTGELLGGILYLSGFGIIFICALLYAFHFVSSTEVTCVRQEDTTYNCETRTLFLNRVQTSDHKYTGVINIIMNEICDDEGCMYSTSFITKSKGSFPLSEMPENDFRVASELVSVIGAQMAQGSKDINYKTVPLQGSLPLFCYVAVFIVVVAAVLVARGMYLKYRQPGKI